MPRTIEQVRTDLTHWEACLKTIGTNQEYRIGTRWYTRANLSEVYKIVKDLRRELAALERGRGGGMRVQRVLPRDD